MNFEVYEDKTAKDEAYVLAITLKNDELPNLMMVHSKITFDLTSEELIELAQECHQITRPGYIYCHYKDEIKELKELNEELEKKIDNSMDTSLILMGQKDELGQKILDLQEENSKLNERISGYSKFEKKLLSEIEYLRDENKELNKNINNSYSLKQTNIKLGRENEKLEEKVKDLENANSYYKTKNECLTNSNQKFYDTKQDLEKEIVVLREVNIKLDDKNEKLEKKVRDLSNAISFLKTKTKKLEILNSSLTNANGDFIIKIDDLEEKNKQLKCENKELDEHNDDLIMDNIKLEKKVDELTDVNDILKCKNEFLEGKWSKAESKLFLIEKLIKDSDLDSCEKLTEIKSLLKN